MSTRPVARVLDVGQCSMDHASLRSLITSHFAADVDRVMSIQEALAAMRKTAYDLVLVNRLIFDDHSEGLRLVEESRRDPQLRDVPIMMVSNYPEAQAEAVAAGALPGFGKSELYNASTRQRLATVLPLKAQQATKRSVVRE